MIQTRLCDIDGKKIRRQYFNIFVYLEIMLAFVPVTIILGANSIWGDSGTKLSSISEYMIKVVSVFFVLMLPCIILSAFNRKFLGKIVCVLSDEGICFEKGTICWDNIERIEYEIRIFPFLCTTDGVNCYANIITADKAIKINQAPHMLLSQIKKQHPDINIKLGKTSFLILSIGIGVPLGIALLVAITIICF